jgi:SPP1 family phage portal protein
MVETKAAVIFYPVTVLEDGKKVVKLRAQILNKSKGDFYPHFDDYGDMDAFLYLYKALTPEAKSVEKARIYTADTIFTYVKNGSSWEPDTTDPEMSGVFKHSFGKIPVVYVEQKEPEWESVTPIIDNFENRFSRLADTNDYFSEPLLKIFGSVTKLPGKDEVGKVLEFAMKDGPDGKQTHGDAEYATWDDSPESIKLDLTTSWDSIFSMTSTPDLSFNNIKGIGNVSGVAMKLMFLDAFIARGEKMEIFEPALRRCISVVISGMENYSKIAIKGDVSIDDIEVSFTDTLPSDIKELVETIYAATGGKQFLSQKTAVSISPLTNDSDEEIGLIQSEATEQPNESVTI